MGGRGQTHNYQVLIGSVYYQPTSVRINAELSSAPWTFEIDFPEYPTGLRSSDMIDVYRDGKDIFTGQVLLPTQNFDIKRGWKLTGIDRTNFLLKNSTYAVRANVNQEPKTIIQSATSYSGVGNGAQSSYGAAVDVRVDWNQCIDVVSQLTGRVGWETLVHPVANTLDFANQVGSDKSAAIRFKTGENCTLANYQDRRDAVVNRVWMKGKGTSDANEIVLASPYYIEDVPSQGVYGLRSQLFVERDIDSQANLLLRAQSLLAKLKISWPVYTINVKEPRLGDITALYWIGDTVAFACSEMAISGDYRINRLGIIWDEHGEIIDMDLNKMGLAFQDLAETEKSYLIGLYGPQIFAEMAGISNTGSDTGNSNVSGATGNSNTGHSTGNSNAGSSTGDSNVTNSDSDSTTGAGGAVSSGNVTQAGASSVAVNWPTLGGGDSCGYWGNLSSPTNQGNCYLEDVNAGPSIRWQTQRLDTASRLTGYSFENTYRGGHTAQFGTDTGTATLTLTVNSYAYIVSTHTHPVTSPTHNHTLNSPSHTHTVTDPTHTHTVSDPTHTHAVSDPTHTHAVSDPTHTH